MKNKYSAINLFCIIIAILTQTQQSLAQNSSAVKEVTMAVEQLRAAMISADSVMLSKLAADKLVYGHSGGTVQNKQEFIHGITSGGSVFVSIDLSNQTIVVVNNTAVVRHTLYAATNDKGKGPGTVKLAVMLTWIKNDKGEWQLLARQAVKI
jgi:hypothetical protein